jgi:hypothetical protein
MRSKSETVRIKPNPDFNLSDELTLLEKIWLKELKPFRERGYNKDINMQTSARKTIIYWSVMHFGKVFIFGGFS